MNESLFSYHLFNKSSEEIVFLLSFILLVHFFVCIWLWYQSQEKSLRAIFSYLSHNRSVLLNNLFWHGPGFLILSIALGLAWVIQKVFALYCKNHPW